MLIDFILGGMYFLFMSVLILVGIGAAIALGVMIPWLGLLMIIGSVVALIDWLNS